MSWADRIAHVCHDFEDAVHVGITAAELLPPVVIDRCRTAIVAARPVHRRRRRRSGRHRFGGMTELSGRSSRRVPTVQLRPHLHAAGIGRAVPGRDPVLRASSSTTPTDPHACPGPPNSSTASNRQHRGVPPGGDVRGGMTDRFALDQARTHAAGPTPSCPSASAEPHARPLPMMTPALRGGRLLRTMGSAQSASGTTLTSLRLRRELNLTVPSARANSVSSPPMPTFSPGWMRGAAGGR